MPQPSTPRLRSSRPPIVDGHIPAGGRQSYAALDASEFPHSVAVAGHLYDGTADQRFEWALDALLEDWPLAPPDETAAFLA